MGVVRALPAVQEDDTKAPSSTSSTPVGAAWCLGVRASASQRAPVPMTGQQALPKGLGSSPALHLEQVRQQLARGRSSAMMSGQMDCPKSGRAGLSQSAVWPWTDSIPVPRFTLEK